VKGAEAYHSTLNRVETVFFERRGVSLRIFKQIIFSNWEYLKKVFTARGEKIIF